MNLSRSDDRNVHQQAELQQAGLRVAAASELACVEGGFSRPQAQGTAPGVPIPYPHIGLTSDTSSDMPSRDVTCGTTWLWDRLLRR